MISKRVRVASSIPIFLRMDPSLEQPDLWPEVYCRLLVMFAVALNDFKWSVPIGSCIVSIAAVIGFRPNNQAQRSRAL